MSEHDHAPPAASRSSATATKSLQIESNSPETFIKILRHQAISKDEVEATLHTKRALKVGMSGSLWGLPAATVTITRVFAGGAKARVTFPGIAKEIDHHGVVILDQAGIAAANAANGHLPHAGDPKVKSERNRFYVAVRDSRPDGDGLVATIDTRDQPVVSGMTGSMPLRAGAAVVIEKVSTGSAKARITGIGQAKLAGGEPIVLDARSGSAHSTGVGGGPR